MPKITKKSVKISKSINSKKIASKKKVAKVKPVVKEVKEKVKVPTKSKIDYIFTVGRRKESVARVRYYSKGKGEITINNRDYKKYFTYFEFQNVILEPLNLTNKSGQGKFSIKVSGGGLRGQAESIRLGISRLILKIDPKLRPLLRSKKLLTRDPRVKERKKYGLKKARRAPQWQKR